MDRVNFIVLAPNKWNSVWMNRQHIFSILGKQHNVIYSNGPLFYWDRTLPRFKESFWFTSILEQDNVKVVEFPKTLMRVPRLKLWDNTIKKYFKRLISKFTIKSAPTVLYIFNPLFHEYIDEIPHDFLVYHPYDDFTKLYNSGVNEDGNKILAKKADIVITTSSLLKKNYENLSSNVHFVPNGVDFDIFCQWQSKTEDLLLDNGRRRVGYTGSLNSKMDISLLYSVCSSLPDIDFYIVGGVGKLDEHQLEDFNALKALDNCYFLGNKKLRDVPSYMRKMDINIIPYRTDPDSFANAGYPLKLHEYLTVGKPIICSPIDSAFEFSDVLHIKETSQDWITSIQHILMSEEEYTEASETKRRNVAKSNTWIERARTIEKLLEVTCVSQK